jgi:hypothetical protein
VLGNSSTKGLRGGGGKGLVQGGANVEPLIAANLVSLSRFAPAERIHGNKSNQIKSLNLTVCNHFWTPEYNKVIFLCCLSQGEDAPIIVSMISGRVYLKDKRKTLVRLDVNSFEVFSAKKDCIASSPVVDVLCGDVICRSCTCILRRSQSVTTRVVSKYGAGQGVRDAAINFSVATPARSGMPAQGQRCCDSYFTCWNHNEG